MSDVVFILGAGASCECGAPLMSDFLDIARNLLDTKRVEESRREFERVFETIGNLQRVHSKANLDLNNIGSIFTVLELGKVIRAVPGVKPDEIPEVIAALKVLIVKTLEHRIMFPIAGNSLSQISVPRPYCGFMELIRQVRQNLKPPSSVSIITFNYDLLIDVALYNLGAGPHYVLGESPKAAGSIELMKLHGSLNWATESENKQIRILHLQKYFERYHRQPGTTHALPIGSCLVEYFQKFEHVAVSSEPLIVPPSWNKSDYHQALSQVWARAAEHLSEARHIVVLGYSLPLTDSFFRHLYALGSVGKHPLRSFVVMDVERQGGRVDRRFKSLLGPAARARYKYIKGPFSSAENAVLGFLSGQTKGTEAEN